MEVAEIIGGLTVGHRLINSTRELPIELFPMSGSSEIDEIFNKFYSNVKFNIPTCQSCVELNKKLRSFQIDLNRTFQKVETAEANSVQLAEEIEGLKSEMRTLNLGFYVDDYNDSLAALIEELYTLIWKHAKKIKPPHLQCSFKLEFYEHLDEEEHDYVQLFNHTLDELGIAQSDLDTLTIVRDYQRFKWQSSADAWQTIQSKPCPDKFLNCKAIILKYQDFISKKSK